jgi:hypothetical protein
MTPPNDALAADLAERIWIISDGQHPTKDVLFTIILDRLARQPEPEPPRATREVWLDPELVNEPTPEPTVTPADTYTLPEVNKTSLCAGAASTHWNALEKQLAKELLKYIDPPEPTVTVGAPAPVTDQFKPLAGEPIPPSTHWRIEDGWVGGKRVPFLTHDNRDGIRLDAESADFIGRLMRTPADLDRQNQAVRLDEAKWWYDRIDELSSHDPSIEQRISSLEAALQVAGAQEG